MISQLGEAQVRIGKNVFHLKCSFKGLVEMENRACTGLGGLSYRLISKTMGINDVTAIIYGGIIGKLPTDKAPSITFEELGEQIKAHGMSNLIELCMEFIHYGMTGGKEPSPGKKKV